MKIKIAIILVTAVIAVLLCLLPYKETWSMRAFVFGRSDKTSLGYTSVKDDLNQIGFDGIPFLIVFFPVLLTSELLLADRISSMGWRIVFIFQGLLGLAILLYWVVPLMILFEIWVQLKAGYYIFHIWVIVSCILSILAGIPKVNRLVLRVRNSLTKQSA